MKKKLTTLLEEISNYQYKGGDVEVSGVSSDSRKVKKGDVFVAVRGLTVDAHDFIDDVIKKGAVAIVGEIDPPKEWLSSVVYVKVSDTKKALGVIASAWFDYPSKTLKVIGITGTDGKTTTANILYEILSSTGLQVGLVSTISAKIGKKELDTGFHVTNPDPIDLHSYLNEMVQSGCTHAILEVTSHGLDQERIAGVDFDIGVLTNITHEHIDYHGTWEAYRDAKAKLFEKAQKAIVLNKDDNTYEFLSGKRENDSEVISYSLKDETADLFASNIVHKKTSSTFLLKTLNEKIKINVGLIGDYNISNTLAAIGAAKLCGVSEKEIEKSLVHFSTIKGRMEEIENDLGFRTIVDFAHTPNSLEKVLTELRKQTDGKLICVFGCAGRRDIKKRELMPEVSARLADISVFTAEDPRDEKLEDILTVMEHSASKFAIKLDPDSYEKVKVSKDGRWYISIPERGEAIFYAIQKLANKGDIVVVCGKGHERSLAFEDVEHPWSDQEFVRKVIETDNTKVAVILSAGRGTRFKSEIPKNLHTFAGRSMLSYELENLRKAGFGNVVIVVGYKAEEVKRHMGPAVTYALQEEQLGTGHAAFCGMKPIKDGDDVVIMYGDDGAFYPPSLFEEVHKLHNKSGAVVTFVSVKVQNPHGFGRVVYGANGELKAIVEEKDTTESQKKINEVNDGVYMVNRKWFLNTVPKIKKKAQGEYLLTDIVEIALSEKKKVEVYKMKNSDNWFGVNTPEQLAEADRKMRERLSHI